MLNFGLTCANFKPKHRRTFSRKTRLILRGSVIFLGIIFLGNLVLAAPAATDATNSTGSSAPPIIGGKVLPGTDISDAEFKNDWFRTTLLKNIINLLISFGAALAVIFLIIAGYQYLTAVGNEEQVQQAHKTFTFALVGLAVALTAFLLVQILVNIQF